MELQVLSLSFKIIVELLVSVSVFLLKSYWNYWYQSLSFKMIVELQVLSLSFKVIVELLVSVSFF